MYFTLRGLHIICRDRSVVLFWMRADDPEHDAIPHEDAGAHVSARVGGEPMDECVT